MIVSNSRFGFTSIAVSGQNSILADNTTDTLVLVAGEGIQLTTNSISDSITLDVTYLKGSVFSDTSTMVINGATGTVVGPVATSSLRTAETQIALGSQAAETNQGTEAIAIGRYAGQTDQALRGIAIGFQAGYAQQQERGIAIGTGAGATNQGSYAIAIGQDTSNVNQGTNSIAIGQNAGGTGQGANSIAIGRVAGVGFPGTFANSIILNASGSPVISSAAGFYVSPIREVAGPQVLYYDPTGKEVTWGPVPAGGVGGGTSYYEFSVAGDDSTQRVISSGETLRFAGAGGVTTTTDGEGRVTITGPTLATVATSGSYNDLTSKPTTMAARSSVNGTTASIADAATDNVDITGFKGYLLYKIQTSAAAWVRIYTDTASRTADSGRSELTDPAPGSGVVAEIITTGAQTILISPGALGFNNELSPTTNIPIAVTNKSGGTTTITTTLTVVQVEA